MQDNSIKDDFGLPVDKGWVQMEAQLDEAMPQRRRRVLWWWLPALALMLGVGLYAWSLVGQNFAVGSTDKVQTITEDIPVANIAPVDESKAIPSAMLNKVPSTELTDQPVTASVAEVTSENTIGLREQHSSKSRILADATDVIIQDESFPLSPNITEREQATRVAPETISKTSKPQETTSDSTEDTPLNLSKTRALTTTVAPLAHSSPDLLQNAALDAGKLPELSAVQPPPKYRFYAEVLAGEALEDQFSSILLGLGVERSLSTAWQINGGLQFQYGQSNLFSEIGRSEDIALGVETPTTGGGFGTVYDISNGFNVLKTQRLNIYTQVGYQIHPRLKISAGLQASSFQHATAGLSSSADEYNQQSDPETADFNSRELDLFDEVVSVASFDQVTNAYSDPRSLEVRRWQWSAQSSISYRLHPAWSMELQYLRHLTTWPTKGESFGGPHSLQLGFRYYFRK